MFRTLLISVACVALLGGCAGSNEARLEKRVEELEGELFDTKQRTDDLKAYLESIQARNRVLVGLVEGLTARPGEGEGEEQGGQFKGARRALEQLDRDLELLATTLRKNRDELKLARRERSRLKNNFNDAMQTLEDSKAREAQATARVDTFRVMVLKLKKMIDQNQLDVQVVRNQMVVKLPEALLFDRGSAKLKPDGQRALQELASVLRGIDDREFQVAGHTDDTERRGSGHHSAWELSAERAVNVTRFLIEQGVAAQRLSAAGYGSTRPLDASPTPEARARNRRIEIVLMPNLGELPDLSTLEEALTEQADPTPVMRLRASPSEDEQPPPVMKIQPKGPPPAPTPPAP